MSGFRTDPNQPHLGGNIPEGDPQTMCPGLWAWLRGEYGLVTMLDVGCGSGHALRTFQSLGYLVTGIDGLEENIVDCGDLAIQHDLTEAPFYVDVNLVWCCEVVEHIEERYVDKLLDTITRGKMLAMTHALPGQTGYHHVNEQPASYWIEKLMAYDMIYMAEATREAKTKDAHENHFSKTGLLFWKAEK